MNLALKAILVDRASMTTPTVLGYEASWGDKVRHQGTIQPDLNVSTFKLHLAHVHPMRAFFPEEGVMELATKTTLFINGRELVDEHILGGDMENKTTG